MAARRAPIHLFVGLAMLIAGEILLFAKVEPFYSWFYSFAWWSWILFVDGVIKWRKGNSLIADRTREFASLAFWSIAFWNVFELFNFRLRNWYYVMVPADPLAQMIHGVLAYATVLPGVFETTELIELLGPFRRIKMRPWKITPRFRAGVIALGVVSAALTLAWPFAFFGLVWGCVAFLLDPIVHRAGGRSLLADFERGDPSRFLNLLAAGFVTGGLWEFWNFWTRTKWIYTVPGFEHLKLFEMPVLGFIGFPPFVVECYAMYAFLGIFRGHRGWEEDAYRAGRRTTRSSAALAIAGAMLFNVAVTDGIGLWTVSSYDDPLSRLGTVPSATTDALEAAGIRRPPDLLRAIDREGVDALAARAGVPVDALADLRSQCEVVEAKGLGIDDYRLLRQAGIADLRALASQDPVNLALALEPLAEAADLPAPSEAQAEVWILEAQRRSR